MQRIYILLFVLISLASCKKEAPHYKISDGMKQFFVFKEGSYWIYINDSTGETDSSFINKVVYSRQGINDDGREQYSFDMITLYFKSQFISDFEIGYFCLGPNCLTIASKLKNPDILESSGPIAYFPGWEPNINIYSQNCLGSLVFTYKILPQATINNNIYVNIIYSKFISIDSTTNNPVFYFREIYFAKNIGIIKYVENREYFNIERSFSLTRCNVIQ